MTARRTWNAEQATGKDEAEREAFDRALALAQRSGLSLGAWLNGVVQDAAAKAGDMRSSRVDEPLSHSVDEFRVKPLDRRGRSAVQLAGAARRGAGGRENLRLSRLFHKLSGLAERVNTAEHQAQRALELAERRLEQADRLGQITAGQAQAYVSDVDRARSDLAAVERDARQAMQELVGETQNLRREAAKNDPRLSAIIAAVQAMETRLDDVSTRLNEPASVSLPSTHDERLAKIEGQLSTIARQLQEPQAQNNEDLTETLRQIALRQQELNAVAARPGEERDQETLRDIHDRLSELAEQISQDRRAPPPIHSQALAELPGRLEGLQRSVERASPEAMLDRLFGEIKQLGAKIGEARRCGLDGVDLARMEQQIDDVRHAFGEGQLGEVMAQVRAINSKLEDMMPRQDIAAIDRLREDIAALRSELLVQPAASAMREPADHAPFDELHERIRHLQTLLETPAPPADDRMSGHLQALAERIDALADRLPSAEVSATTQRMVGELRERVEALASHPPAPAAFAQVEERLLHLIERIEQLYDGRPEESSTYQEFDVRLKRMAELMEMQRDPAPQDHAIKSLEQHVSEIRRSVEGSDRRMNDTLDALHGALARLDDRMAAAPGPQAQAADIMPAPATAASAKPGAALPGAAHRQAAERKISGKTDAEAKSANAERSALSAAREAAARAAEIHRQSDGGQAEVSGAAQPHAEIDLPLEPGSGKPSARAGGKPAPMDGPVNPSRPEDPVRAARLAMQKQNGEEANLSTASKLRSSFITAVRRTKDDKAEQENPSAATMKERTAATTMADDASSGARKNFGGMVKRVAVVLSAVIILASAVRIILSLGDAGGEAPKAGGSVERPAEETPAPKANLSLLDPSSTAREGSVLETQRAEPNLALAPGDTLPTKHAVDVAPLPPLPEDLGSERLKQALGERNPRAFFDLATRLADGRTLKRDVEASIPWFVLAAESGHAPSYYRLGNIYEKGLGPKRDMKLAVGAYQKAATLGNRKAMHNLATLYASGSATGAPDYDHAVPLFEQAAGLGLVDSQFNLAVLLVNGLGTKQDLGGAYKWFAVAAQNGDKEAAKKRDEIGARLTGQALIDARLAAENFRPKALSTAANDDQPQTFLFEDNPLSGQGPGSFKATPNLGISVEPAAQRN